MTKRLLVLALISIVTAAIPAYAQLDGTDTVPGSSCAGFPDGATRVTADADLDGADVVLVCDGTNWQAVGGSGGSVTDITLMDPFVVNTSATSAHGLGTRPTILIWYLENKTADVGYSPGDRVYQLSDSASNRGITIFADSTNVGVATNSTPHVVNKSTFATGGITDTRWKVGVLVSAGGGGGGGGSPASPDRSVQFNSGGAFAGSSSLTYTAAGDLGIGDTAPTQRLSLMKSGDDASINLRTYADSTNSYLFFDRARGTEGAPTAVQTGSTIMGLDSYGYNGTTFVYTGGIYLNADENFTGTARGSRLSFETTNRGTTTVSTRMRITSDGYVGIATTGPNATLDVNGSLAASNDVSPASIAANQNNYAPTGHATASVLRLTASGAYQITGLQGGVDGRILTLVNIGTNAITLVDESASSAAANRFALAGNVALATDQSAVLLYDSTSSRWRVMAVYGPGGAASAGGSDRTIQFNNSGSLDGVPVFNYTTGGVLSFWRDRTDTAGTSVNTALFMTNITPTANQTVGSSTKGLSGQAYVTNTNTFQVRSMRGVEGYVDNRGTGAIESMSGTSGYAANLSAATVSKLIGAYAATEITAGTVNEMYGILSDSFLTGGNVTNFYGVYVDPDNTSATVANRYGIYLTAPTGTATNDWGIYQDGTQNNYLRGGLGIGTNTPDFQVQIENTAAQAVLGLNGTTAAGGSALVLGNNGGNNRATFEVFGSSWAVPALQNKVLLSAKSGTTGLNIATLAAQPISFHTNSDGSSNEAMRIASGGNVSIGTTQSREIFQIGRGYSWNLGSNLVHYHNAYYDAATDLRDEFYGFIGSGYAAKDYFNPATGSYELMVSTTAGADGAAVTWTDGITISKDDVVGIGPNTPIAGVGFDMMTSMSMSNDISPASIGANQNDYNPANLAKASVLRLTASAAYNITGLAGGVDGRVLTIMNIGTNTITLKAEDAASTAANRFDIGTDIAIAADQAAVLMYDSTSSRWRAMARPGGGSTEDYQVFTASGTWTKPAGVNTCDIELWGGGGGGGGVNATAPRRSSGGGGGAYFKATVRASTLSATESVTVGAGGTAGSNTGAAPTSGGNSTFDVFTAYGGALGQSMTVNADYGGGAGGGAFSQGNPPENVTTAAGGDPYTANSGGESYGGGGSGQASGGRSIFGGGGGGGTLGGVGGDSIYGGGGGGGGGAAVTAGGNSVYGGAGGASGLNANGSPGVAPGGGGGGTRNTTGTGRAGGAGARGEVRVRCW